LVIRGIRRSFTDADKAVKIKEQRKTDLVMLEIVRSFTEIKKLKNMKIELNQAELNELIYALGFTQMNGKLSNKEVADKLDTKLYQALVAENARIADWDRYVEEMVEKDSIERELNTKWRVARWTKHCKDSWNKDVK